MARQLDVKERWRHAWRTEKPHVSLQSFGRTQLGHCDWWGIISRSVKPNFRSRISTIWKLTSPA